MKEAVTIYKEWVTVAETLPSDSARGRFFMAVCRYALTGEEPTLTGPLRFAFELMRHGIDVSAKRRRAQEQGVRKRLQNKLQNSLQTELQNDLQTVYKTDYKIETCKPFCKSSKGEKEKFPPAPPYKEKGEKYIPPHNAGAQAHEGEGYPGMSYPETVEDVLAIAALPQCGARLTEEDARKYLVFRMASGWVNAAGVKIPPSRVVWDVKKWEMGQNERRPAKGKNGVDYSDPETWGDLER